MSSFFSTIGLSLLLESEGCDPDTYRYWTFECSRVLSVCLLFDGLGLELGMPKWEVYKPRFFFCLWLDFGCVDGA